MEIKEVTIKKDWEEFLAQCHQKTFLHSWNWGEFQRSLGYPIFRFGIFEEDQLISVALVIEHRAKRGSFLLVPHGPVVNSKFQIQNSKIIEVLIGKLKELAKQRKVDFIRISPIWERT